MKQLLWLTYQTVVIVVVYSALREGNPDIAPSAIAVTSAFAAFVATALPLAIYDLALRIRGRVRGRAAQQRANERSRQLRT